MSGQRKLLLITTFIIIDLILIGGFFALRNVTERNILAAEISSLVKLDFKEDRYNKEVKSNGSYTIVETAIKSYLDNYALKVQEITDAKYDPTLVGMTNYSNYFLSDNYFDESLVYIEEIRVSFNEDIEYLVLSVDSVGIDDYIYRFTDDEEYISLYKKLVNDNKFRIEIEKSQLEIELEKVDFNSYLDANYELINFMKTNINNYSIVDDEVHFVDNTLFEEYSRLLDKVKRIY